MNASSSQQAVGLVNLLSATNSLSASDQDIEFAAITTSDAIGCILGATSTDIGKAVTAWAKTQPESAQARAFVLGALSNVLEMDAMHVSSSVHPGTVVIPAALAVAIGKNSPTEALFRAILRGSEAALRLGRSTGAKHRKLFQSTSTCAAVGAALACSDLFELDEEGALNAMGNAASTAGGLWAFVDEETNTKQWHAGHASQVGVACAQLASHGVIGARHVIDSTRGFHTVLCPDPSPDELSKEYGQWQLLGTSFKPWPCPRPAHSSITATLKLSQRVAASEVEKVVLRTFGMATGLCDRPAPDNPHHARFSLQHCVAAALIDGRVDFASFEMETITRVAQMTSRVLVSEDAQMSEAYPGLSQASIEVTMKDGTTVAESTDHALGDPEYPLVDHQLKEKQLAMLKKANCPDTDALAGILESTAARQADLLPKLRAGLGMCGVKFAA